MNNLILKCWNGIYGCSSFIIEGWEYSFNNILEAGSYYKTIWGHCWIEDPMGQVLYRIPSAEEQRESQKALVLSKLYELCVIDKGGD